MQIKIINDLLKHIQNCGSREDILTSILATMFQNSPDFTQQFLQKPELFGNLPGLEEWCHEQGIDTGCPIKQEKYSWMQDEEINFIPDILLFSEDDGYWVERPNSTFLFFIEAKIYEDLTDNQIYGYPAVHTEFSSSQVKTLLIAINPTDHDQQLFDQTITWEHVLDLIPSLIVLIHNPEMNILLHELFILLRIRYHESLT